MPEEITGEPARAGRKLYIAPSSLLRGQPELPSSKYYTLRYVLAATLARGESTVAFPAVSEDSEALFRACRALGAQLQWCDEQQRALRVNGVGRPHSQEAVTINVGNAGAVLRLLLGPGALLPEVTFITDHAQSLGKRPNRELLEALTSLGAVCEGTGLDGYLPVTIRGGKLHGGRVTISGARSSQYLSSLLFLAPLIGEPLDIDVVDNLKSQALVHVTLNVLEEAGIVVENVETLRHFYIPAGQDYQPRPGERDGDVLLEALRAMDADVRIDGDTLKLRGGRRLRGIEMDGDGAIDCIPVLVAAACFAEGESVFYNIESLHYKESDRIDDLCAELRRAGCIVTPRQDAILVRGQPQGVEGGVVVDAHSDHRLLMALAIVALRSRHGLTLSGVEHIAKSYPHFFQDLQELGAEIS